MRHLVAVVPARAGSVRVPNKCARRDFTADGRSLLDVKIETLLRVHGIDAIVVNSDSQTILDAVKRRYPTVVTVLRDAAYARATTRGNAFLGALFANLDAEHILYASCTTPFVRAATYEAMIQQYLQNTDVHDSLSSVRYCKDFLWTRESGPVNYTVDDAPNSQELTSMLALTFGCMLIRRDVAVARQYFVGSRPAFYVLDDELEALDIDTPLEYAFARQQIQPAV